MKKLMTLTIALCVSAVFLQGCYGPFKLTRKVYEWNGSVEDKWGREALFLVLYILPVYGFSVLADALVFNSIDFWGGENPISCGPSDKARMIARGNQQAVLTLQGDRRIRIDLFAHYRPMHSFTIEAAGQGMTARDSRGSIVMSAVTLEDGSVSLRDAQGTGLRGRE